MSDVKLKQCPFCGSTTHYYKDYMSANLWLVQCENCGVSTLHNNKSKSDAKKIWNNRVNENV